MRVFAIKIVAKINQAIRLNSEKSFSNSSTFMSIFERLSQPKTAKSIFPAMIVSKKRSCSSTKKGSRSLDSHESLERFSICKVLGIGSWAVVRLVVDKNSKEHFALKTYEKTKLCDPQKRKNLAREVKILSRIKHSNIIRLHDVIDTANQFHLVMEFPSCTSLDMIMKSRENRRCTEDEARPFFKQLVEAIQYCHRKQVVHRDIKLENILFDSATKQIKLIDFGFSIALAQGSKLNVFCGTLSYMAPEIVNEKEYSFPVDIWALGVLLFKVLEGEFPFRGADERELIKKINSCKLHFHQNLSYQVRRMLTNLLRHNQYDRYTSAEILNDEWFNMSQEEQK